MLFPIDYFINLLDGVFAFIIYDTKKELIIAGRDPYGIRPMFYSTDFNCFSSELKQITNLTKSTILQFPPGHYSINDSVLYKYHTISQNYLPHCSQYKTYSDEKNFYSTDILAKTIYKWDYNHKTKSLSNKKVLVKIVDKNEGMTDGMTIDSEGFIWSAIWGGSKVIRFDPDGVKEREIIFPATQTSCPMFGGKDLNELYVTTASAGTGMTKAEAIGIEQKDMTIMHIGVEICSE